MCLVPCFVGLLFIESIDDGISNDEKYLFSVGMAAVAVMPVVHSIQKESGNSTRQFLSALPIRTRDIILSKLVVGAISLISCVLFVVLGNYLFNFGFSIYHFCTGIILTMLFFTGYLWCHYIKNHQIAQTFIVGILALLFTFIQYNEKRACNLAFLSNLSILMGILVLVVAGTLSVTILVMKKKRRL